MTVGQSESLDLCFPCVSPFCMFCHILCVCVSVTGMKVEESCQNNHDCVTNAKCDQNKCKCMEDYEADDDKFCKSSKLERERERERERRGGGERGGGRLASRWAGERFTLTHKCKHAQTLQLCTSTAISIHHHHHHPTQSPFTRKEVK